MAKSTKKSSSETGETNVKPSGKKAVNSKTRVKKVSSKSTVTGKNASSKNAVTEKQALAKETVARKATSKKKAAPKKAATPKKKAEAGAVIRGQITSAERYQMIAEAAYLRAESQGFLSDAREDWLRAEAGIDSMLTRTGVIVTD